MRAEHTNVVTMTIRMTHSVYETLFTIMARRILPWTANYSYVSKKYDTEKSPITTAKIPALLVNVIETIPKFNQDKIISTHITAFWGIQQRLQSQIWLGTAS